ncbi:type II toxin-antitoxin system VapC family toxin [Corynebacterium variabile]|uniref:Predicted nucleic acid-binding protein, contains PIN domain n=1 Tax=Corynebacterium variabile TaxID=1727 RepID=A0A0X2NP88_9CORY|nr:type II toxin-antitoxin system VapC family toxin [Corynebacterium variabile]CUU66598.1 Predicted nucleic acid-binding protein, contains PIN domain [Corynebacterium variabile]
MSYLVDTNVISELRRRQCDPRVQAWMDDQPASGLFLNVITVIEIETGILRLSRRDRAQATELYRWFQGLLLPAFEGRILAVDLEVSRKVARLHVPDPAPRHDALIAGTALVHDLTVVTRNIADFDRTGVSLLNPWES